MKLTFLFLILLCIFTASCQEKKPVSMPSELDPMSTPKEKCKLGANPTPDLDPKKLDLQGGNTGCTTK